MLSMLVGMPICFEVPSRLATHSTAAHLPSCLGSRTKVTVAVHGKRLLLRCASIDANTKQASQCMQDSYRQWCLSCCQTPVRSPV